jgi:hypothetical protein
MDPTHRIDLYVKILTRPFIEVRDLVLAMRAVYGPHGIHVCVAGSESLSLPTLTDLDVGSCSPDDLTWEQLDLFANRNGVPQSGIAVYFVRSTNPPLNGCAAHLPEAPAAVVSHLASRWTLGHEIGHVLGLKHVNSNDRLMTGNGTFSITYPPPKLTRSEAHTIRLSPLVKLCENPASRASS